MSDSVESFDKRAMETKGLVTGNESKPFRQDTKEFKTVRSNILQDLPTAVRELNGHRTGDRDRKARDIDFPSFVKEKWGFAPSDNGSPDSFYQAIGLNPTNTTIESLMNMPEFPEGYRWLIPEVIREAIRLGLRKSPIYGNLIAAEETVTQPKVIMPHINMSDAMPSKVNESETIPVGSVSFGDKTVKLEKVGTGLKLTDEVQQYVPLNVLSLYLQDVGVKLNLALDTLAVDTLINGDQDDGSEAAPLIGVQNTNTFTYFDFLRAIARLHRLGRTPQSILSNENPFLEIYNLAEFKGREGSVKDMTLNVRTPLPTSMAYDIHGAMPADNQVMLIDSTSALIKLNASALKVESERIVERQITGTFVTLTTGYATLFRDARLILDKSKAFSSQGFPSWFDVSKVERSVLK